MVAGDKGNSDMALSSEEMCEKSEHSKKISNSQTKPTKRSWAEQVEQTEFTQKKLISHLMDQNFWLLHPPIKNYQKHPHS